MRVVCVGPMAADRWACCGIAFTPSCLRQVHPSESYDDDYDDAAEYRDSVVLDRDDRETTDGIVSVGAPLESKQAREPRSTSTSHRNRGRGGGRGGGRGRGRGGRRKAALRKEARGGG